jgi:hypothetical protein
MEKTALQQVINLIEQEIKYAENVIKQPNSEHYISIKRGLKIAREHMVSLLPVEREQIETAYSDGIVGGRFGEAYASAEHFFTNKYKAE